jgi:hypothetical protein
MDNNSLAVPAPQNRSFYTDCCQKDALISTDEHSQTNESCIINTALWLKKVVQGALIFLLEFAFIVIVAAILILPLLFAVCFIASAVMAINAGMIGFAAAYGFCGLIVLMFDAYLTMIMIACCGNKYSKNSCDDPTEKVSTTSFLISYNLCLFSIRESNTAQSSEDLMRTSKTMALVCFHSMIAAYISANMENRKKYFAQLRHALRQLTSSYTDFKSRVAQKIDIRLINADKIEPDILMSINDIIKEMILSDNPTAQLTLGPPHENYLESIFDSNS